MGAVFAGAVAEEMVPDTAQDAVDDHDADMSPGDRGDSGGAVPDKPEDSDKLAEWDAALTEPDASEPVDEAPADMRLNVLVAEDNATNQLVFRKMVAGYDLNLRFANNGQEAVEAYMQDPPDIIFMDISMPVMDGKAATQSIRNLEPDGHRTPIIAVTAHAVEGDRESILESGLDDYLTKPVRKAEITAKLMMFAEQIASKMAS